MDHELSLGSPEEGEVHLGGRDCRKTPSDQPPSLGMVTGWCVFRLPLTSWHSLPRVVVFLHKAPLPLFCLIFLPSPAISSRHFFKKGNRYLAVLGPGCGLRDLSLQCSDSLVMGHGLSSSETCGTFLDQGSNPRPLHYKAEVPVPTVLTLLLCVRGFTHVKHFTSVI